jgi:hypothetical protein
MQLAYRQRTPSDPDVLFAERRGGQTFFFFTTDYYGFVEDITLRQERITPLAERH